MGAFYIGAILFEYSPRVEVITFWVEPTKQTHPQNPKVAKINPNKTLPSLEDLERKLERLIGEQERLGGVNLLAEQEGAELEKKVNIIKKDQSDLLAAISKLREAIDTLNTEGRQRLLASYGVVNEHFQRLFVQLFGGGKAYLKFTDESDPLEAGLEIYASPPGKKLKKLGKK